MRGFTKKQNDEVACLSYFVPHGFKYDSPTDEDIRKYFEYSNKGLHKEDINNFCMDGFNYLVQGSRWRGITVHEMYEPGIISGDIPYIVLLEGSPEFVVDYLANEMFKGKDSKLILNRGFIE